ncbi:hypothetical protein MOZ60_10655 [Stecheria sp. CLA-KB-P133]|uniref:CopG family transcriptional regulator n=1 Tax=Grylomicrobium aquisgranensis TaxID=2926318 RepID=A0AB35U6P0_9FIRM|nr:hypothetical protein [Stecheria sp. CLA-KB-P133]
MKDFKNINTEPVYNTLDEATAAPDGSQDAATRKERRTYTEDEADMLKKLNLTSGRKGVHLQRINMAFLPENYEYIKVMAKGTGRSMTQVVNDIIAANIGRNKELYSQIQKEQRSMKF